MASDSRKSVKLCKAQDSLVRETVTVWSSVLSRSVSDEEAAEILTGFRNLVNLLLDRELGETQELERAARGETDA